MKSPRIIVALAAVAIAAPALSNAQASRPGPPTPIAQLSSEKSNHDDDICGLRTLRGTYVFAASGFNIVAGIAQPKAIIEVIEFNGDGTLSVPRATLGVNGMIVHPPPSIGTYTVENDCSGAILFGGPTFDIFISSGADEIWMIQTIQTPSSRGRRHGPRERAEGANL